MHYLEPEEGSLNKRGQHLSWRLAVAHDNKISHPEQMQEETEGGEKHEDN